MADVILGPMPHFVSRGHSRSLLTPLTFADPSAVEATAWLLMLAKWAGATATSAADVQYTSQPSCVLLCVHQLRGFRPKLVPLKKQPQQLRLHQRLLHAVTRAACSRDAAQGPGKLGAGANIHCNGGEGQRTIGQNSTCCHRHRHRWSRDRSECLAQPCCRQAGA